MKKLSDILLIAMIIFLGLVSCDEAEEQAVGIAPFFNITFIDNDSLSLLQSKVRVIDSSVNAIDTRVSAIDAAENKGELLDEKNSLNTAKDSLSAVKSELNKLISSVNSGLATLSSVNTVPPEVASRTQHSIGINSNSTTSLYSFIINEQDVDTLLLSYQLDLQFIENQMRAVATQLDTPFHTFDSIRFSCTNCTSNEVVLTAYF